MQPHLFELQKIASKPARIILGLMSGTSMDGLDLALCSISGHGFDTECSLLHFKTVPYPKEVRSRIEQVFPKEEVSLRDLTLLHTWLGKYHGQLVNHTLAEWSVSAGEVDLVASHGQTIYHAPLSLHGDKEAGNASLQIGDGDQLAVSTGIICLSDFRQKHIAGGGEGAPLAVYGDALLFGKEPHPMVLLNIGGISNFTYLPGDGNIRDLMVTDCGPGNTLMDAFVQKHFPGKYYDKDGKLAGQGTIRKEWLDILFRLPFFKKEIPKSTGQEIFNLDWVENKCGLQNALQDKLDMLATLNQLTVKGIANALRMVPGFSAEVKVYVSGGGVHNKLLLENLESELSGNSVFSIKELGIEPDAKEAMLFAILANQSIAGGGFPFLHLPALSLGKISLPG